MPPSKMENLTQVLFDFSVALDAVCLVAYLFYNVSFKYRCDVKKCLNT